MSHLLTRRNELNNDLHTQLAAANERLAAQDAELATLRENAKRYQWLREQHWSSGKYCVVRNPKANVRLGSYCPSRERLDEAIDAAIAYTGHEPAGEGPK